MPIMPHEAPLDERPNPHGPRFPRILLRRGERDVNSAHRLDDRLFLAVNSFARSTLWLHGPMMGYAKYGVILFAVLLLAAVFAARHRSSAALACSAWAALAMLAAVAINQPLGHLFAERRPYAVHPGILRLADVTTDFSFPSDHAVMAGAVAAGLLLAHRRLGSLAAAAALLMAFARVYIGAHYPWDVAAGLLVGAVVSLLGWVVLRNPLTAFAGWLRAQPALRAWFSPCQEGPLQRRPSRPMAEGTRR